jgi:hypothetical protein
VLRAIKEGDKAYGFMIRLRPSDEFEYNLASDVEKNTFDRFTLSDNVLYYCIGTQHVECGHAISQILNAAQYNMPIIVAKLRCSLLSSKQTYEGLNGEQPGSYTVRINELTEEMKNAESIMPTIQKIGKGLEDAVKVNLKVREAYGKPPITNNANNGK